MTATRSLICQVRAILDENALQWHEESDAFFLRFASSIVTVSLDAWATSL